MTSPMPAPSAPPPAPPFVPGAVLRSPVGLGRATAALLGLAIAADLFACAADVQEMNVAGDIADGARGDDVLHRVHQVDALYTVAGHAQTWTLIATAVVYLCWLWRVRVNAEAFDRSAHSMRRGWVIGGWFCPVVHLWFPRRIVLETWDASVPWGARTGHGWVNAWWTLWIVDLLTGYVANVTMEHAHTARLLRNAVEQMLFSDAVGVAAGVLAIVVVVRLTRMQHRKALAGQALAQAPAPAFG
ncbi:DUF4328 domain-containing protein [Streptomyces camelliae]|uniref:DUF4328 domain-containing protein n=1 Tax=Streptomyces camelliae TaxID=3004093 RepID=A0ABY7P4J4_9ACTN|nr:DUF4328 domain-containing protein [Streptomyces sp. HUAS 2-6]WBO64258.1 DUF4328 domain-containing protein [Streptomyces sp. HUAS 2-6]